MASPPVTIGEITDVPAPQSAINAQFMQEVANRITHRFATVAQMNAWAAGNGSLAFSADTKQHYARIDGAWLALATQTFAAAGIVARTNATPGQTVGPAATEVVRVTFTADTTRWYRTTIDVPIFDAATLSNIRCRFAVWDAGSTILREAVIRTDVGLYKSAHIELDESGLSGSIVRRLVVTGESTSGIQLFDPNQSSATFRAPSISVADMGAV